MSLSVLFAESQCTLCGEPEGECPLSHEPQVGTPYPVMDTVEPVGGRLQIHSLVFAVFDGKSEEKNQNRAWDGRWAGGACLQRRIGIAPRPQHSDVDSEMFETCFYGL